MKEAVDIRCIGSGASDPAHSSGRLGKEAQARTHTHTHRLCLPAVARLCFALLFVAAPLSVSIAAFHSLRGPVMKVGSARGPSCDYTDCGT